MAPMHAQPTLTSPLPCACAVAFSRGASGLGSTEITPKKGATQICLNLVEWLYYSQRIIIVRWADLSDFFRPFSFEKRVFLFHVQ